MIQINRVNFIVDKFIPLLFGLKFVKKKYKDFLDWAFVAYLIYKGKHTTEAGRELIIKISKGMNNYRLSTNVNKVEEIDIPESLIKEVLEMDDIYIKGKDGLRIKAKAASTKTLVNNQLFYILASGPNNIVFKGSK